MSTEQLSFNDWADFWREKIGVNVIPAITKYKKPKAGIFWTEWQTKPIPESLHQSWKDQNAFNDGMAVIVGKVWHRKDRLDYYLGAIDCDNLSAIRLFCADSPKTSSYKTIVEQHPDNPNKCHIFLYTSKPLPKKSSDMANPKLATRILRDEIPGVEIKGDGRHGIMYVTPSPHENGSNYTILGITEPDVFDDSRTDQFIQTVDAKLQQFGISYTAGGSNSALLPMRDILDDHTVIYAGHNRHEAILRYAESIFATASPNITDGMVLEMVRAKNQMMCDPPLEDDDLKRQIRDAKNFILRQNGTIGAFHNEPKTDKKPPKNHAEIADLIMEQYNFATLEDTRETYWYHEGVYIPNGEIIIEKQCEQIIPLANSATVSEVISTIKRRTFVPRTDFDSEQSMINFKNCWLDIITNMTYPHSPGRLSKVQIPIFYDPAKSAPRFLEFLDQCLPDEQDRFTVLEQFASCLIKSAKFGKAYLYVGQGANGKCQKGIDLVLMADGSWKQIKDISVGDQIVSPQLDGSSQISKVTNIHSRFETDVYDVVEHSRRNRILYTCAGNHDIPFIRTWSKRTSKDDSTPRITERRLCHYSANHISKLTNHKSSYCSFSAPLSEFNKSDPLIDPYTLGVYLGDGNSNTYSSRNRFCKNGQPKKHSNLIITSADKEIMNQISIHYTKSKSHWHGKASAYHLSIRSDFARQLKQFGLWGKLSGSKFIPKICLTASSQYRIRLLDGLIDTDGFVDKQGAIWITTKSYQLACDIEQLVFSLGGFASIRVINKSIKSLGFTGKYFEVSIQFERIINNLIPRKQKRLKNKIKNPRHIAIECLPTTPQMVYGIEIDSPSHWYVTNNWMVTHNSSLLGMIQDCLGTDNVSHISIHAFEDNRFAKAELDGKMANIYADISNEELNTVSEFKALVTGDAVLAEKKNKNPFVLNNTAKMFFSANQIPIVYDESDGFFRRFMIIEWNVQFTDKTAKINLRHDIITEDEKSGILNILIQYARNLEQRGYFKYAESVEKLKARWKEKANSAQGFLDTQLAYDESYVIPKSRLESAYKNYCADNKLYPLSSRKFNDYLRQFSVLVDDPKPHRIDQKQVRVWLGATLKSDMPNQTALK